MRISRIPVLLLVLGLVSCRPSGVMQASVDDGPPQQSAAEPGYPIPLTPAVPMTVTPSASTGRPIEPPDLQASIELAERDLAGRLQIDPAQIAVSNSMEITWPNILAGCTSSPPEALAQGRVYGYRITLQASGAVYIYHVGASQQVVACALPGPGANNPLLGGSSVPTQDPRNSAP